MDPRFFMRSMLTATLIIVATGVSVQAQMTAPAAAGAKPKQVAAKNPKEPTGLEGMEDIDEILKRRGIT